MEIGIRVVRGPDWKWNDQDSGDGHLGTVVEIGKPGNNNTPDKTAVVHWDNGFRTNYRVGYQSSYDLRVYDTAPTGVKHPQIACDACGTQGVMGMRWKCATCHDFDLCHTCYMAGEHDLTHPFTRFLSPDSVGVKVEKRSGAAKVQAHGIFRNAIVKRGPDWDWGNQDGGEERRGTVLDLRGWDNESGRSVANIAWQAGITNVYRLGHKGKVDLKCIESAPGGFYYRDHLPVLGQEVEVQQPINVHNEFKVGDRVRVDLEVELLKPMQEGHGGWNQRMAQYIGKVGHVHRITDKGDVRVQFDGCTNRWTFFTGALTKVQYFSVGDHVKVSDDLAKVKDLQKGHGEWTDSMRTIVGRTGRVQKVYVDGDLRITVGKHVWTINPVSCSLVKHNPAPQHENSNTHEAEKAPKREDPSTAVTQYLSQMMVEPSAADRLVKAAAQGHTQLVHDLLADHPDIVDQPSQGKTALQVASHQGYGDIVTALLDRDADLQLQDADGDTALHYSTFGNKPEMTDLLVSRGAVLDLTNTSGCTPLHVAVNKMHAKCVEHLLAYNCDPNVQDLYGDTPLHDAVGKDKRAIVDMLLAYPASDLTRKNKRGFNVLQHAALKGNQYATQKILLKSRDIVDMRKGDGFSALHLAALNGHLEVATALLCTGRADMEIKNHRQQTPLFLAVSQAHTHIVELLVKSGASLDVVDEEGDTPLHLALKDSMLQTKLPRQTLLQSPAIAQIQSQLTSAGLADWPGLATACYMLQKGADPSTTNHQSLTPFDVPGKPDPLREMLKRYTKSRYLPEVSSSTHQSHKSSTTSTSANKNKDKSRGNSADKATPSSVKSRSPTKTTATAPVTECMVCDELFACVTFQPCGHCVVCMDCCVKMKKCLHCQMKIDQKFGPDKKAITMLSRRDTPEQRLRELEDQLATMEDTINCSICMERRRTMAFMCGHSACKNCAAGLKLCHICRQPIRKKIALYES